MTKIIYLVGFLVLASGCQTEEERAHEAVMNYAVADRVHAAPFRSYLFVSDRDKEAMTAEAYAAWHPYPERPASTRVEVGGLELNGARGSAEVMVADDVVPLKLVRDEDRWRVHLGLTEAEQIDQLLADAEEAKANGRLERALELIDKAQAIPFDGSLASELNERIGSLQEELQTAAKRKRLDRQLAKAERADLDGLKQALPELSKLSDELDTKRDEVAALRERVAELRGAAALEGLTIPESKVRRFYEGNDIVYELDLTLSNTSEITVTGATLLVRMRQRDEFLGERTLSMTLEPPLEPGGSRTITEGIPDGPIDWKSRDFEWEFTEVEIVDE